MISEVNVKQDTYEKDEDGNVTEQKIPDLALRKTWTLFKYNKELEELEPPKKQARDLDKINQMATAWNAAENGTMINEAIKDANKNIVNVDLVDLLDSILDEAEEQDPF